MSDTLAAELAELPKLTRAQLQAKWRWAMKQSAPSHLRKQLLVPLLAYKLQEQAYGGLGLEVKRRLRELANGLESRPGHVSARLVSPLRIKPGRVIRNGAGSSNGPNRIPEREIEELVLTRLKSFFGSARQIMEALASPEDDVSTTRTLVQAAARYAAELDVKSAADLNEILTAIVFQIVVQQDLVHLELKKHALRVRLLELKEPTVDVPNDRPLALTIPAKLKRCGREMCLIIPDPRAECRTARTAPSLLRAHEWGRRILAGDYKNQRAIANATGPDERYVSRIFPHGAGLEAAEEHDPLS